MPDIAAGGIPLVVRHHQFKIDHLSRFQALLQTQVPGKQDPAVVSGKVLLKGGHVDRRGQCGPLLDEDQLVLLLTS